MTEEQKQNQQSYTAKDISVLEGLEPVRKRPGMYIGGTSVEGLHHLVWEVLDNSIDEAMAGFANKITIELLPKNKVKITDNGRGIPVDIHAQTKKSALETVLTTLHAGGKFGGSGYKVSGGLHGVGVSVVNALSDYLEAEVHLNGKIYKQEYCRGKAKSKVAETGVAKDSGTTITFSPDPEIFEIIEFSLKAILERARQQAYLTRGIKISVMDARDKENPQKATFYFEGGINAFVQHLNKNKTSLVDPPIYTSRETDNVIVEVALSYTNDFNEHTYTFANNIATIEGGMHLTGFKTALTRAINDYAKKNELLKGVDAGLTGDDAREGLTAIVSVKLPNPQFEGQTKGKLGNPEIKGIVESAVSAGLSQYFEEHPNDARKIVEKVALSARARMAARAARDTVIRKGALEGMTLPGKLADCSEKDAAKSEIFIVEGDSAGGCFSEDTEITLADGRNLSFRNLIVEEKRGKQNYCYTIKKSGEIGIEKILNPRITKKNVSVIKIILDNGEKIVCTPDHKFMLRDGSYLEAKKLSPDMSLMPLQKKLSKIERKIKKIELFENKIDVYDIEVPNTHNFALASGVFVHNSAKQGRERKFQAILPLKGKILNVERARLDRMLSSDEIKALIVAMGAGIGEELNVDKIRYHRIIIMTDADVDGSHIRTLLLTLFFRHFKEVIEKGYIYIAQPPLYMITSGKEKFYAYSDKQKDAHIKTIEAKGSRYLIQRYKGLGEMNPIQLWETTMNPESRKLMQVKIEDAEAADETFSMLMGDEVPPRKRFIQTRAKTVSNLDI